MTWHTIQKKNKIEIRKIESEIKSEVKNEKFNTTMIPAIFLTIIWSLSSHFERKKKLHTLCICETIFCPIMVYILVKFEINGDPQLLI